MTRTLTTALLVLLSFLAGVISSPVVIGTVQAAQRGEGPPEFAIFWETWEIVHDNFVFREALDPTSLTYGAIRGMVEALGDEGHTRFLTPDELLLQLERSRGSIHGIGIQVRFLENRPVVVKPLAGSPAEKAGIRRGDIILEVDGEDTFGWDAKRFGEQVHGAPGSPLTLRVVHPGEIKPVTIVIIRAVIELSSVSWAMIPGTEIGWIRLDSFSRGASNDIKNAAAKLRGAGATSVILDLRNNPGGLLTEAVKVSGHFLGNAVVLQQEDRFGTRSPLRTEMPGIIKDLPLVVLVNEQSASASEILAGAIQDNRRGEIIGERTIGTGTVLSLFELEDNSAILLGTTKWLTPDGRSVRRVGITPDLEVANETENSWLTPDEIASSTRPDLLTGEDLQLATAIRHLLLIAKQLPELDLFDIAGPRRIQYP